MATIKATTATARTFDKRRNRIILDMRRGSRHQQPPAPVVSAARKSRKPVSGSRRLRGGAGRTRTNHQSVMEHGWCPTNYPGRTPFRIAGRFAVLLDFPGFLILDQPPKRYGTWLVSDQPTTKVLWNMG